MIKRLIILVLSAFMLSGCLLERLFTLREQVCDFENHFAVTDGRSLDILFHEPVLLDSDVQALWDAPPSEVSVHEDTMISSYVFERLLPGGQPEGREYFRMNFDFVAVEGEYRLAQVTSSELPMGAWHDRRPTPEVMADEVCGAPIDILSRRRETVIDPAMLEMLPDRAFVLDLLGEPTETVGEGDGLVYSFRLMGSDDPKHVARFTAWFDGNEPVRFESGYGRYYSEADLVAGLAWTEFSR